MDKAVWDEKFKIGVEVVDKAHAKLFRITDKLLEHSHDPQSYQNTYKEGIKYLEAYSMTHFSEEEEYMRSIRYKGYARHKKIHDNFRDKTLVSLKKDLELSGYSPMAVERFVTIMNNWLSEHIMADDQEIVGRSVVRRNKASSTQISLISRGITRAAQEVFQAEAELISTEYKGQNIGKAFYCRQHYDVEGGARVQMLLGVEEPLFLRGVNLMLRARKIQKGASAQAITLGTFEPLFQNVSKSFRVETEYEFGKENLLTRDQYRTDFMKGYPCSLLFSTRAGYLVCCCRSWRISKP